MRLSADLLMPRGFWRTLRWLLFVVLIFASAAAMAEDMAQEAARKCYKENNADYCGSLAIYYEYGINADRDEKKALKLYRQACIGGDIISCRIMGFKSVLKPKDALFYFDQGCRLGDEKSCSLKETALKN